MCAPQNFQIKILTPPFYNAAASFVHLSLNQGKQACFEYTKLQSLAAKCLTASDLDICTEYLLMNLNLIETFQTKNTETMSWAGNFTQINEVRLVFSFQNLHSK